MSLLLNWRIWLVLGLSAGLAFTHFTAYRSGRAAVLADWTTEKLELARAARAKETTLAKKAKEVDDALQIEKRKRADADRLASDRLRDLTAALASANPATPVRTDGDDPRDAIIGECAGYLVALDAHAGKLASQVTGLQNYTRAVCLAP